MNDIATLKDAPRPKSVLLDMADRFGMEPAAFEATLRATVVPDKSTREQFAAFLLVAKEYDLNPLTKEIYAFPTRAGGIQPIVSIDGWMNILNSHRQFDGMEFEDVLDDGGKLKAITCRMYRKDRSHPTMVTEYMSECVRNTDTWKQWPARMLRHKAAIQCARYAFGFSGLMDEDEYERMQSARDETSSASGRPKATVIQSTGNGAKKSLPPVVGESQDLSADPFEQGHEPVEINMQVENNDGEPAEDDGADGGSEPNILAAG